MFHDSCSIVTLLHPAAPHLWVLGRECAKARDKEGEESVCGRRVVSVVPPVFAVARALVRQIPPVDDEAALPAVRRAEVGVQLVAEFAEELAGHVLAYSCSSVLNPGLQL